MKRYRIRPGEKVDLSEWDPADVSGVGGSAVRARRGSERSTHKLERLQELLHAEHRHAVLIVLQGMDAAGKDGAIRHVFEGVNPQGVRVVGFKQPTPIERDHDFLWRVHAVLPALGEMVIFNRSHYEDVLAARVHKLAPKKALRHRYEEINEFERTLSDEGTTILKFFLHLSPGEQIRRLRDRLADPSKNWKFSPTDLAERRLWGKYTKAYEEVLTRTSTDWAPWYVVPADAKWYRDWVVSGTIVRALEGLEMRLPGLSDEAQESLRSEPWALATLRRAAASDRSGRKPPP
ncbi:MAG TPA: polyphosphate kinase 2 family protein [Thermoplasmata archaeon]|nr:polyphosphate kinase 2 family protein [Thermoplasmata archaeon]